MRHAGGAAAAGLWQQSGLPRCKTTLSARWDEPRKRPIGYALSALFMLVLANIFPFINMRVAGIGNEIRLIQIPEVMVAEDYASMATLFMVFVQLIPAFCMVAIILLCAKVRLPLGLKEWMARVLFQFKTWCMVEIFLAGVLVSFVKADGLRRYRYRQQLRALLPVSACCRCARLPVRGSGAGWQDIEPAAAHENAW